MNIEAIKKQNLEIAQSKGFGVSLNKVSVSEKIALIHSEVSEAYSGYLQGNLTDRHGLHEELADVFLRTLHLAGIFEINFPDNSSMVDTMPASLEIRLLTLHKAVSESYEFYRHKELEKFKQGLIEVVNIVLQICQGLNFDLEKAVQEKMEINKGRTWDKKELNENL